LGISRTFLASGNSRSSVAISIPARIEMMMVPGLMVLAISLARSPSIWGFTPSSTISNGSVGGLATCFTPSGTPPGCGSKAVKAAGSAPALIQPLRMEPAILPQP
jgi:hypothetical protein